MRFQEKNTILRVIYFFVYLNLYSKKEKIRGTYVCIIEFLLFLTLCQIYLIALVFEKIRNKPTIILKKETI